MRTLRFPRKRVERRKSGDAAADPGKNVGEKADGFGERFGAAIRIGDKKRGTAKFMGEIGREQSFRNVVKAGKRDVLRALTQSSQRPFHGRVAKHGIEAFANGRKNHEEISGFHARGGSAFANLSKNSGGGVAGDNRNGDDAAADGFHFFPADDLVAGPVAAFDQYIWQEADDHFTRSQLIENHDSVHAFKSCKNFTAFAFGQNRTARAFQLANAGVTVNADDQGIAERACFLEAGDVARMQKIEAAVGEDDALAVAFLAAKPQNRFVESQNLRVQRNSMKVHAKAALVNGKRVVYHAREGRRLRSRFWR